MRSWLNMSDVAAYCHGKLIGADSPIIGVSTDTRSIKSGELFVALQGDHFDGHDYVDKAIAGGASGLLLHKPIKTSLPTILVADTLQALTEWSRRWRAELSPKVVGVTGSNGKTTVKQLTSSVLSQQGSVCFTQGNLNNHIGVPLTLLTLRHEHDFAVIEMGANHQGEISHLTKLVRPDIAVLTNAGPAHLEGFGSLDGVAQAKAEIFEGLSDTGIAVLNRDDDYFEYWHTKIADRHAYVTISVQQKADYSASRVDPRTIQLTTPSDTIAIKVSNPGTHYLYNLLAATAVATELGLSAHQIKAGLESAQHESGRLQLLKGVMGTAIFDDTYNANPASLRAAIEVLAQQKGVCWLVMGDMAELGKDAEKLHAQIGDYAKHQGIDRLFCLGPLSRCAAEAFGAGAQSFLDREQLAKALLKEMESNICILVKGSRAMRMEEFVGLLKEPQRMH